MSKIALAIRGATMLAVAAPLLIGCAVHESAQVSATPPPPPEAQVDVKVDAPKPPPPPAVAVDVRPAPPPPPPPAVVVEQAGPHPHYLRALSDLREARANLFMKGGDRARRWDEGAAIGEIDAAIAEIKRAAIDDGKNLEDHPAVDAHAARGGLLHNALATLTAAREDISHEDERWGNGLRARAAHHIDEAIRLTELGIRVYR